MVALLAEGVDRNTSLAGLTAKATVALLAEGVDRNLQSREEDIRALPSPSSRRAWIEIIEIPVGYYAHIVALLAEGVDRNVAVAMAYGDSPASPSSRRAWIEIKET